MFWKLLLAFTVIPAVELYLLVSVGQWIGPLATVLLIVLTGLVGAALAKREGMSVLNQLRGDLGRGIPPAAHLVEGAMVLAGGLLLLTPGLLTDLTGFLLILPPSRRSVAPMVVRWLLNRFDIRIGGSAAATAAGVAPGPAAPSEPSSPPPHSAGPFDHPAS
jgi:UPF0716 protein FxsA